MLSVVSLTRKRQYGTDIFPIKGELYCETVSSLFRGDTDNRDLKADNIIISAKDIYHWLKHHIDSGGDYTSGNFHTFGLQSDINESKTVEVVCDEGPVYRGNAREFVDQIDSIETRYTDKILAMTSVFCYLWPKSVYDELFSRGYKVLLDELFESRISHLYGFLTWCCMVGIPTENFIILSGRYNAHANIDTSDIKLQNRDMDFDAMGASVVNYPAFFWHFEQQVQSVRNKELKKLDWGTNCNFEFPYDALLLNRAERFHRILAIAYLQKHNKLDHCKWSMLGTTPANLLNVINGMDRGTFKSYPDDRLKSNWLDRDLMQTIRSILPRTLEEDSKDWHTINPKYYTDTKFSFITETIGGSDSEWDSYTSYYPAFSSHLGYYYNPIFRMNHRRYGFITEKTFRPISVGHPFVVLGNNKLLYTLQAMGFETYHDIWNEGYNDVVDDYDRFYQTMDTVIELMDNGFNERAAKKIAESNKTLFWDSTKRKQVMNRWLLEPLLDAYYGRV